MPGGAVGVGRPSRYGGSQPDAGRQPEPRWQEDPNLPYRLAEKMWNSELSKSVENSLRQANSLKASGQVVALASTMPLDSVRSTLRQMLQRHWEDGPSSLESAGLLDDVVTDPGFVTVVKSLPRKEPKPETEPVRKRLSQMRSDRREPGQGPGAGQPREGAQMRPPGGMPLGAAAPGAPGIAGPGQGQMGPRAGQAPADQAEQDPGVAWMLTSEDLVHALCERLLAAAKAKARAAGAFGEQPASELPNHGLPFELRPDATVVAEYHVDWPAGEREKLSGVPLGELKLHYVRTEQMAKVSTLESFYKRKLSSFDVRPIDNGTWMDSLTAAPEEGWKRSIDLMFTTPAFATEQDQSEDLPVTTDILCIDIKDPAPKPGG